LLCYPLLKERSLSERCSHTIPHPPIPVK